MRQLLYSLLVVLLTASSVWAQASPDNSRVPPLTSVKAADGATFTFAAGTALNRTVLRNGVTAQGSGSIILTLKGVVYVLGDDAFWYQYTGGTGWGWTRLSKADPCAACPPVVVIPPIIVPVANRNLGWTVEHTTAAVVAARSFKLYVDAAVASPTGVGTVVVGHTCVAASPHVTCSIPLQTLMLPPLLLPLGQHTFAVTYLDEKKVESVKSAPITVILSVTGVLAPVGLRLE